MTDALEELYYKYYLQTLKPTPEYQSACRMAAALREKLLADVSPEVADELFNRQADELTISNLEWFREGVRLSASLLLAL